MTRLFGILLACFLVVTAFGSVALAKDSPKQGKAQGLAKTNTIEKSVKESSQLASNGFEFNPDGLAGDIYHLITGIHRPLDASTSMTIQAGTSLQIGLTF